MINPEIPANVGENRENLKLLSNHGLEALVLERMAGMTPEERNNFLFATRPDISIPETTLATESAGVYETVKSTVGTVVDYTLFKPANFIWETVKAHPLLTSLMLFGLTGYWYYSAPLEYGLSGLGEEGLQILKEANENILRMEPQSLINLVPPGGNLVIPE